jgi:PAS domain S-box-containing protein
MGGSHEGQEAISVGPLTELLLGALGDGVYGIDAEGRATFLNPAAEAMLGYSVDEFVGHRQHDAVHWSRPDGTPYPSGECVIYGVLRDGQERRVTGDLFWRRDGSSFPADYTVAPIREGDLVVGAVVVFRDVTERVDAQRTLSQAWGRQQALLENLPDAAWMKDAELRFVAVNEAFVRGSGFSREAFLGHTVKDLLGPESAARYEEGDRRVLENDDTVVVEERLPWGGAEPGDLRWIETIKRPLPRIDGRPSGLVAIARDVTDRRRREQAKHFLAEAGQVIIASLAWTETLQGVSALIVPAMGDWCAISALDDKGDVEGVVTRAADLELATWLRTHAETRRDHWGPENELIGRAVLHSRGELHADLSSAEVETLLGDVAAFGATGGALPRSLLVVPLVPKTRARGVIVLARGGDRPRFDARDLALVDQVAQWAALALEHAWQHRAATEAVRARDEVLRVVAHDLRSSVATVGLSAGALAEAPLEGCHTQALDRILEATERMDRLIQDIMDASRVEAGWLPLEPVAVDAGPLVDAAVRTAEIAASDRGIELVVQRPDALPAVRVDRHRALQVFSNLLGNAVKYTEPGGRITLDVELMGSELLFCVRDTGPGIPEEELPHVFDRFRRGPPGSGDGIGLGLSIARGIVTAHGGRIWAGSEQGQGSRFCFTLPLLEAGMPPPPEGSACPNGKPAEPEASPEREPIRVLVVDDHEAIRHGVRAILDADGNVEVAGEAAAGEEAVAATVRLRPDVVILDLSLPDADGYEVMRRIAGLKESIRTLVLTAHAPERSLMRAMKSGAFGFVRKATAHKELGRAVRTVMRGEVFLDSTCNGLLVGMLERTAHARRRLSALTDPEIEIVRLTAEGFNAQEIGQRIFLSPHTVASYRSRAMRKLDLERRSDLVHFALETDLICAE